jgi:hypothetical protein
MISPVDTQPAPPASTTGASPKSGRGFALLFAVLTVLVTAGTIALAAIAPSFNQANAPTLPSSWSQAYDSNLSTDDGSWGVASGCAFQHGGLDAVAPSNGSGDATHCVFQPSRTHDYLSNGFLLQVTLDPAPAVTGNQVPLFVLGSGGGLSVDQSGTFLICTDTCTQTLQAETTDTFAWHGVAANTVTLQWLGPGSELAIFANGQRVTSVKFDVGSESQALALGAAPGDEAIFTHVTLYSAS